MSNENFTQILDGSTDSSKVTAALLNAGISIHQVVVGTVNIGTSAVGSFAVLDANGDQLIVPTGGIIIRALLSADVALVSGGAPDIDVFLGTSAGTTGTTISGGAAVSHTDVNDRVRLESALIAGVTNNNWVIANVATAGVTTGTMRVVIEYA